jgi:hypothetical protein
MRQIVRTCLRSTDLAAITLVLWKLGHMVISTAWASPLEFRPLLDTGLSDPLVDAFEVEHSPAICARVNVSTASHLVEADHTVIAAIAKLGG